MLRMTLTFPTHDSAFNSIASAHSRTQGRNAQNTQDATIATDAPEPASATKVFPGVPPRCATCAEWRDACRGPYLPQSGLAQAIDYALGQWPTLIVYLADGRVEIDNNLVENAIHRVRHRQFLPEILAVPSVCYRLTVTVALLLARPRISK